MGIQDVNPGEVERGTSGNYLYNFCNFSLSMKLANKKLKILWFTEEAQLSVFTISFANYKLQL